jgi:hypothetical protein
MLLADPPARQIAPDKSLLDTHPFFDVTLYVPPHEGQITVRTVLSPYAHNRLNPCQIRLHSF